MKKFEEIIIKFINQNQYFENKDIEGIIFYGSAAIGYTTKTSDIDLQIITSNNHSELIRGITTIDGFRIDYFEKPLSDYYKRAIFDFNHQSNVLLPMIGHGMIIFDRNDEIKKLQSYINNLYANSLPKLPEEEAQEMIAIIDNRMIDLRSLYEQNNPYFNHLYHLTIEKIKKFYHRLKGLPEISTSKTLKIYTDTTGYREKIFKTIPEPEFIDLYIKALNLKGQMTLQEKMDAIEKLYQYAKRDVHLDKDNYRIRIKPRY